MGKFNLNSRLILNAARKAIKPTADHILAKSKEVIEEEGAFPAFPDRDIVDTGALRDSGIALKITDDRYQLSWQRDYAIYVHEGYTLRNGNQQKGRPWTKEGVKRAKPIEFFVKELKKELKL